MSSLLRQDYKRHYVSWMEVSNQFVLYLTLYLWTERDSVFKLSIKIGSREKKDQFRVCLLIWFFVYFRLDDTNFPIPYPHLYPIVSLEHPSLVQDFSPQKSVNKLQYITVLINNPDVRFLPIPSSPQILKIPSTSFMKNYMKKRFEDCHIKDVGERKVLQFQTQSEDHFTPTPPHTDFFPSPLLMDTGTGHFAFPKPQLIWTSSQVETSK